MSAELNLLSGWMLRAARTSARFNQVVIAVPVEPYARPTPER